MTPAHRCNRGPGCTNSLNSTVTSGDGDEKPPSRLRNANASKLFLVRRANEPTSNSKARQYVILSALPHKSADMIATSPNLCDCIEPRGRDEPYLAATTEIGDLAVGNAFTEYFGQQPQTFQMRASGDSLLAMSIRMPPKVSANPSASAACGKQYRSRPRISSHLRY